MSIAGASRSTRIAIDPPHHDETQETQDVRLTKLKHAVMTVGPLLAGIAVASQKYLVMIPNRIGGYVGAGLVIEPRSFAETVASSEAGNIPNFTAFGTNRTRHDMEGNFSRLGTQLGDWGALTVAGLYSLVFTNALLRMGYQHAGRQQSAWVCAGTFLGVAAIQTSNVAHMWVSDSYVRNFNETNTSELKSIIEKFPAGNSPMALTMVGVMHNYNISAQSSHDTVASLVVLLPFIDLVSDSLQRRALPGTLVNVEMVAEYLISSELSSEDTLRRWYGENTVSAVRRILAHEDSDPKKEIAELLSTKAIPEGLRLEVTHRWLNRAEFRGESEGLAYGQLARNFLPILNTLGVNGNIGTWIPQTVSFIPLLGSIFSSLSAAVDTWILTRDGQSKAAVWRGFSSLLLGSSAVLSAMESEFVFENEMQDPHEVAFGRYSWVATLCCMGAMFCSERANGAAMASRAARAASDAMVWNDRGLLESEVRTTDV